MALRSDGVMSGVIFVTICHDELQYVTKNEILFLEFSS